MTIEEEIAEQKASELSDTDDSFVYDYSLKYDRIVLHSDGSSQSYTYEDVVKGDYDVENETVQERLDDLRNSLQAVWDGDIEAFELSRTYTDDGDLRELVFDIPTEDEYEPMTVLEIHDEDGNFVADNALDELGEEMLHLKSDSLYVDYLSFGDEQSIYVKEKDEYLQAVKNYRSSRTKTYEYVNQCVDDYKSNIILLIYWFLFFWLILPIGTIYLILGLLYGKSEIIPPMMTYMFTPLCVLVMSLYDLVSPFYKGRVSKDELFTTG